MKIETTLNSLGKNLRIENFLNKNRIRFTKVYGEAINYEEDFIMYYIIENSIPKELKTILESL